METRKWVLGEEHPDSLTIMANLALTYQNQGRWKEAEELLMLVMEMSKRVLGEEHPDLLRSMANLTSMNSNQGRWKEAKDKQGQGMELSDKEVKSLGGLVLPRLDSARLDYGSRG